MIKKINKIHEFGVFNDFYWDTTVRDKGNNISHFKKLNIIYGRNYSGKTTISRIFRCFEKGVLHEKYLNSKFEIIDTENRLLDQTKLRDHSFHVRVYNDDFVKENLKWLIDEQDHIGPFAIIGAKNIEIENKIKEKEDLLGRVENKNGLKYEFKLKTDEYEDKKNELNELKDNLDEKLRYKANQKIKRNPIYSPDNVTYNIDRIRDDIDYLNRHPQPLFNDEKVTLLKEILREEAKLPINLITIYIPSFRIILDTSKDVLFRVIKPSIPIQDLLNNAVLELWVRDGIEHHKGKRTTCGFCGQKIPYDLWKKLDAHFSKESEDLRGAIANHLTFIEQEKQKINNLLSFNIGHFYSPLKNQFEKKEAEWKEATNIYLNNCNKLTSELNTRLKDIFKSRSLDEIVDNSEVLERLQKDFNTLIEENNEKTNTLNKDQQRARTELRLNEVGEFIKEIGYNRILAKIDELSVEVRNHLELKEKLSERIISTERDVEQLKIKMKDEKKGADKVNDYLNHYFGHEGLKLVAHEEDAGFKFNIKRGDDVAYNLSEGERSLVAFCYFMARLEDTQSEGKELIIWIDDPVSSLDSNHVFFLFSLIENIITKPYKLEDGSNAFKYKQLFISTHNLDFLKYLKRLYHPKNDTEYFLVEGSKKNSRLIIMPGYLKDYITEFNYLFHQIYKCSIVETVETEHDCFYNFGNNLRKFLEAYLFYKYPNKKQMKEKLYAFFGDDKVSFDLTNRLDNELSHLEYIFDRSMQPIDIPEIPKLAKYVLEKIKEKDKDQFNALMESLG
jgi:wobble nucleotide-excising tRNase